MSKVITMETDALGITRVRGDTEMSLLGNAVWEEVNLKANSKYLCIMQELPKGYELWDGIKKEGDKGLLKALRNNANEGLAFSESDYYGSNGGTIYIQPLSNQKERTTSEMIAQFMVDNPQLQETH